MAFVRSEEACGGPASPRFYPARPWNPLHAEVLGQLDGVRLASDHWLVIGYLRQRAVEGLPAPRGAAALSRALRAALGDERWSEGRLAALFPGDAADDAARYAGVCDPGGDRRAARGSRGSEA